MLSNPMTSNLILSDPIVPLKGSSAQSKTIQPIHSLVLVVQYARLPMRLIRDASRSFVEEFGCDMCPLIGKILLNGFSPARRSGSESHAGRFF